MCNAIELPLQILLRMANLLLWKFTNSWIVAQKTVGRTKEEKPFVPSKVHFSKSSVSNPDPVQWISLTHVQSCSPHSPTHTPGYRLITTQLVHYHHDLCALSLIPLLPGSDFSMCNQRICLSMSLRIPVSESPGVCISMQNPACALFLMNLHNCTGARELYLASQVRVLVTLKCETIRIKAWGSFRPRPVLCFILPLGYTQVKSFYKIHSPQLEIPQYVTNQQLWKKKILFWLCYLLQLLYIFCGLQKYH